MTSTETLRRWRATPPDCDGWWMFRERSMDDQRILVVNGAVASADEWEQAMDRPQSEIWSENYWAGNPVSALTDGTLTSGLWMYEGPVEASP